MRTRIRLSASKGTSDGTAQVRGRNSLVAQADETGSVVGTASEQMRRWVRGVRPCGVNFLVVVGWAVRSDSGLVSARRRAQYEPPCVFRPARPSSSALVEDATSTRDASVHRCTPSSGNSADRKLAGDRGRCRLQRHDRADLNDRGLAACARRATKRI